VGVAAVARHVDILDVRSPAEFAVDHLPGAINTPVLSDAERVEIGTLHAQVSAFAARKRGAAMVSRNIAAILDNVASGKAIDWAPLVYCWRGGQRSRSLVHVLGEIGFDAVQLDGGYRAWRRHVVATLDTLPGGLRFVVVCGPTGAGKSLLIRALARAGAQALDLEGIACHRGSLLGDEPASPQPSQKHFETMIHTSLASFDVARPIFVESESRRIGRLQLPTALLDSMRRGACVRLDTPRRLRVELLLRDYAHFTRDNMLLAERLAPLAPLVGKETLERWRGMGAAGDFAGFVDEVLRLHYDPAYSRSSARNFAALGTAPALQPSSIDDASFEGLAQAAIAAVQPDVLPQPG